MAAVDTRGACTSLCIRTCATQSDGASLLARLLSPRPAQPASASFLARGVLFLLVIVSLWQGHARGDALGSLPGIASSASLML